MQKNLPLTQKPKLPRNLIKTKESCINELRLSDISITNGPNNKDWLVTHSYYMLA